MAGLGKANLATKNIIRRLSENFPTIIEAKRALHKTLFVDNFNQASPKPLTAEVSTLGEHYSANAVKAVWNITLEIHSILKLANTKGIGREVFSYALSK